MFSTGQYFTENSMNLSKHMEFIFVGGLALIDVTAAAAAAVPKLLAARAPVVQLAAREASATPIVVVKAKRLTAEEKAALAE